MTLADLETASRVVTFACDLGDLAPPGLSLERWDDVPAVSEDFKKARHHRGAPATLAQWARHAVDGDTDPYRLRW